MSVGPAGPSGAPPADAALPLRTEGSGVFVLRGTAPLPAGESAVVTVRFGRAGSGAEPGRCTVNGADCVIG